MTHGATAAWLADLPAWSFAFMLVLARFGAAMALLPGLGEPTVPAMVRVGLALGVTILLLPGIFPVVPPEPESGLTAAGMVIAEVITGLWLGWLARLFCLALPIAAQFIAYLLGISTVLQPDAELGPQSTALAALFGIAAPLAILVSGLWVLPLTALAGSYRLIPPGTMLPAADSTATAVAVVGQTFSLSLRLASPFILASIAWHVAIGLIARLVPRLQIYFVSMPGQIIGGLVLLASLFGVILAAWQDSVRDALAALPGN
ncbi:MAG TPA: flagellar biosynthetic protein FliR [Acetobacteraceae bacterium]|nr:flagellar biosynthetic protein FliR [Acetobacteraceae bacterium]